MKRQKTELKQWNSKNKKEKIPKLSKNNRSDWDDPIPCLLTAKSGLWTVLLGTQRKLPGRKEVTYTDSALLWGFPNTRLIIARFLIFKVFLEIWCLVVFFPLFSLPSCSEVLSFAGQLPEWQRTSQEGPLCCKALHEPYWGTQAQAILTCTESATSVLVMFLLKCL